MNNNEIESLFDDCNSALQKGDAKQVAALYACNATLLPTISNKVRHNKEEIENYFVEFLRRGPSGKIDESNVRLFEQLAINSGVYTFSFNNGMSVTARFTFVYHWNNERWEILEHHSSQMPEQL
ncbi:MAG: hypothetical protein ACI9SP_000579 [Arenicella sp.]|jgi:uncharacterized protein (TIGR02246 family)